METFYSDKTKTIECQVLVEGASIRDTKARLVLKVDDGYNYLFYGNINENGTCKIQVPALKSMDSMKGKAIIEIISENTFVEPWSEDFEIKASKSIKLEFVQNRNDDSPDQKPKITILKNSNETQNITEEIMSDQAIQNVFLNAFRKLNIKKNEANKKEDINKLLNIFENKTEESDFAILKKNIEIAYNLL